MIIEIYSCGIRLFRVALVLVSAITFTGVADAQENTGKQQQGLISVEVVDTARQEKYGLVTLSSGCSGSLLRNTWVITAAHCVDNPDPANPGQFITAPENSVTLTATWRSSTQTRQSARIITFRPNDVAIIRVAEPFTGTYANHGYNPGLYQGSPKSLSIMAFGRGVNQFAQGSGASATPSQTDGLFRAGYFNTDQAGDATYSFPTGNQTIAGGDSGGPSYVKTSAGELLVGVHSSCQVVCMPGKTCVAPSVWRWAIGTPRCTDASVAPLWDDINRYLGAFVPPKTAWDEGISGVLLVGKFRTRRELNGMSSEDGRNTLITELANRTRDSVKYYQSLNDRDLAGTGALLVFLRETGSRTDQQLKTMSADDMRNTAIVEVNVRTGRGVRDLQALSNMDVVKSVLNPDGLR